MLAAPAVRVAVGDLPLAQQVAGVADRRDDDGVGVEDLLAGDELDVGGEPPAVVDRAVDLEAVALSDHVVLLAVAGRRVDQPGAGLERDVVAEDEARLPVEVRVAGDEPLQVGTAHLAHDPPVAAEVLHDRGDQLLRDEVVLAAVLDNRVGELRMHGDRQIRRDRPRGRRPDHRECRVLGQAGGDRRPAADDREAHEDRGGLLLLVLDFGLGQRRAAGDAPVHRLVPAVDAARGEALAELADDRGLIGEGHRQVGVLPVAQNAEPLELCPLDVDELLGVLPARLAEVRRGKFFLLAPERLVDLQLDRKPVAVPSRDIGSIISLDIPGLYNDVLEYLVECVTHVDMAIRVRRPVVENVCLLPGAQRTQRAVDVPRLPEFEHPRFASRQVGFHRECRSRQIQRRLVVHRFAPLRTPCG